MQSTSNENLTAVPLKHFQPQHTAVRTQSNQSESWSSSSSDGERRIQYDSPTRRSLHPTSTAGKTAKCAGCLKSMFKIIFGAGTITGAAFGIVAIVGTGLTGGLLALAIIGVIAATFVAISIASVIIDGKCAAACRRKSVSN